jgi:hypothetical protein
VKTSAEESKMDYPSGPVMQREEEGRSFLQAAASRLKRLHLRFGVWLPVGAALLLAVVLTALYTSFATAERGAGPVGTVDSAAVGIESPVANPAAADAVTGLRSSLRAALRRGLEVRSPAGEGDR